ncbi:hypothetical protein PPERSA_07328 [Pseudocohnilembus persalinus]|uniref:Uncharacterized protein n=1 Tax=Pseudocohnilembus persalinus TaxID=266149 RepID=A0A0V0R6Z7_PSEPJ|nr:hypothetical protein PPERSA_07328 [Pseudocohnilembus persalinus]|eukprot:KRX10243.1 hypothetical protein PPERSA_07328 [Pseudocohnilembus persalinus]
MEPFGANERNWTEEEKESITNLLKYDKHVPLKIAEQVYSAEVESAYFARAGALAGGILSAGAFYFPVVRNLPILRRSLVAALPGLYAYYWGQTTQEDAKWGKVFAAYQRWIVYHGQHQKLFV